VGLVGSHLFFGGYEMNIKLIEDKVIEILKQHDLTLYEIVTEKMGKEKILSIVIDAVMEHKELEQLHMEVLESINDDMDDDYFLQLSTVGIERPLKTLDEVRNQIGSYVYIESDIFIGDATLNDVVDDLLTISFFIKGRPKKIEIKYQNIKFIRQAVKF